MSFHRYSKSALNADYTRAAVGAILSGGLTVLSAGSPIVMSILGLCTALFIAFGIHTWLRDRTVIEMSNDGISTSGGRCVTLPWHELTGFRLRYYATRRDRTGGWMQLKLTAGDRRLPLDSGVDGFTDIVRRAAEAVETRGIELDGATRNNLASLGIAASALSQ